MVVEEAYTDNLTNMSDKAANKIVIDELHDSYISVLIEGSMLTPGEFVQTFYDRKNPHFLRVNRLLLKGKFLKLKQSYELAQEQFRPIIRFKTP